MFLANLLGPILAQDQPTAVPLPGNAQALIDNVLGWFVTLGALVAVGAFLFIGMRVMVGFRRNGQMAADALGNLPYVLIGGIVFSSAAALAGQVIQ